jgi:hypothetical protein
MIREKGAEKGRFSRMFRRVFATMDVVVVDAGTIRDGGSFG